MGRQTLYQRLFTKQKPAVELQYTNPGGAKIGCTFSLDVMDYRDLIFILKEIKEYKTKVNGKTNPHACYDLMARSIDSDDVCVRLMFMPVENPTASLKHNVILLKKFGEYKFLKEIDQALRDTTGQFVITTGDLEERFWRNNDVRDSYFAKTATIKDMNNDGVVDENEVSFGEIEYWDFSRITKDVANQDFTEYLFVELDQDSKMQTIWRGEEINSENVMIN